MRPKMRSDRGVVGVLAALFVAAGTDARVRRRHTRMPRSWWRKLKLTIEKFSTDPAMSGFRDAVKRAKAYSSRPRCFGARSSSGSREAAACFWRGRKRGTSGEDPAFYTVGEASFGLQAGGDAQEVVLLAMTERGVTKLLSATTKLGTDASVAGGPVGAGVTAETAGLSADIISFALSKGVFIGVSLEGAVIGVRGVLNNAYYGKEVNPTDILIRQTVKNPQAAPLIAAVAKVAGGK